MSNFPITTVVSFLNAEMGEDISSVWPWIVKKLDRKLAYVCDVCWRRLNLVANYDITRSSKPARLAIILLNMLVQKQINITTPF